MRIPCGVSLCNLMFQTIAPGTLVLIFWFLCIFLLYLFYLIPFSRDMKKLIAINILIINVLSNDKWKKNGKLMHYLLTSHTRIFLEKNTGNDFLSAWTIIYIKIWCVIFPEMRGVIREAGNNRYRNRVYCRYLSDVICKL